MCTFEGCTQRSASLGRCNTHGGKEVGLCSFQGQGKGCSNKVHARNLCKKHGKPGVGGGGDGGDGDFGGSGDIKGHPEFDGNVVK